MYGKYVKVFVWILAALVFSMLTLAAAPDVSAVHKMHVDVWVEDGATIMGEAYYHGGKVVNGKVEVFAPNGDKLGDTTTSEDGEFSFEAKYHCDHKFVITDGGHRGSATIPAEDLPENLPRYDFDPE